MTIEEKVEKQIRKLYPGSEDKILSVKVLSDDYIIVEHRSEFKPESYKNIYTMEGGKLIVYQGIIHNKQIENIKFREIFRELKLNMIMDENSL